MKSRWHLGNRLSFGRPALFDQLREFHMQLRGAIGRNGVSFLRPLEIGECRLEVDSAA